MGEYYFWRVKGDFRWSQCEFVKHIDIFYCELLYFGSSTGLFIFMGLVIIWY